MEKMKFKWFETSAEFLEQLSKGAFLTVKTEDQINTMTIAWGSIGVLWNQPVFTVYVRPSRYTHDLMAHTREFTISIPRPGTMTEALGICGRVSGRDEDKFEKTGLGLLAAEKIKTPVLDIPGWHFECQVLERGPFSGKELDEDILSRHYPGSEGFHHFTAGKILASYTLK